MTTASEDSNPYDGRLGTGGKFRKRPFRRTTQTTPYDRPPTGIRNASGSGSGNGWLSKLVDPAQRLLGSSAHRLFASVFRKRLTPPRQPPESETNQEARDKPLAATSTDPSVVQGAFLGCENPGNHTDEVGVAELEEILKQKTFTRSEIDRLTSLLRSKPVDIHCGNEEKQSEVKPVVSPVKKAEFPKASVGEIENANHLISTPVVSSTVLDEDVASPAELAKAYMSSRPSKVSILGLHNQMPRGDSALPRNKIFPSKSPIMSLAPRSSGQFGSLGNGFVTPRSRGKSAIYTMARTPYSKAAGTVSDDAFGGPSSSSSQSAWEQSRISGSRQRVLKRRSSVIDNDIGSVGPIRRIRQKSNLLSPKTLSLPASAGVAGISSAGLDALAENKYNNNPGTCFSSVPSKSSEMASKIRQQLDKLVSPGEKSPTRSMIHVQALSSLENVDSSKFLENTHNTDKLIGSLAALPDVRDFLSHKCGKDKENGSTLLVALSDKSVPAVNGVVTDSLMKDNNGPSDKVADSTVVKSIVKPPQQTSQAFQISANEDYLDLDGDDYPNGAVAATFGEGRERLDNGVMGSKKTTADTILVEKLSSLSEVKPISSSAFNNKPDLRTSDGTAVVDSNAGGTFSVAQVATSSVPAVSLVSQSTSTADEDAAPKEPKATSVISFGEKVAPAKQSDAPAPTFGFASTNVSGVSSASGSSVVATSSDQKLENSSSFVTTASGTTNYFSDKTCKENSLNGIFFRTPETAIMSAVSTSTSAGSIFNFGTSKNSSTSNNGTIASSTFSFFSPTPSLVPNNGQSSSSSSTNYMSFTTNSDTSVAASTSTTANSTISCTSSPSIEASVPSFTVAPVFEFAPSWNPSTSVSTLSATSGDATEAKTLDTNSVKVAIVPLASTSAFTSSGSNILGGTSAVTDTVSSTSSCTTSVFASSGCSSYSDTSSTITNSGSGFFSSTFSMVTNTGNGIFGGTSATTGTRSSVFGGTSLSTASTGSSIFSTTSAVTSTGSNIFRFSAAAASISTTQTHGLNPFTAANNQGSATGTGIGTSTQSMPIQFSSSASSPSFGLAGSATFSSGSAVFGSSASVAKPYGSGASFGMSSSTSETNSLGSSNAIASGTFGANWQAPKMPIFSSSSVFSFGSSASITAPSGTPTIFGSSTGASSSSVYSFTSAVTATQSQPVFGNPIPGSVFGSTPPSNNDKMEDSMAEDTVQAFQSTVSTSGQQRISPPPSGSVFGTSNPSGASSFQFAGQPSIATPQNLSPFQASGSLEFTAKGSFSLGTGGGDKSARKFVKVRKQRKK